MPSCSSKFASRSRCGFLVVNSTSLMKIEFAPGVGKHIAHEVNPRALPCGMQYFGDRGLNSFMGIGDHQLDAAKATASELAQNLDAREVSIAVRNLEAVPLDDESCHRSCAVCDDQP